MVKRFNISFLLIMNKQYLPVYSIKQSYLSVFWGRKEVGRKLGLHLASRGLPHLSQLLLPQTFLTDYCCNQLADFYLGSSGLHVENHLCANPYWTLESHLYIQATSAATVRYFPHRMANSIKQQCWLSRGKHPVSTLCGFMRCPCKGHYIAKWL